MYTINEQQIEFILNDIKRNGIEMEDIQLNLLDHICCIIERNLKEEDDFEDFYRQTIKKFYKNDLWEIEEEAINLLIFKNYYTMKKSMIVSGTISVTALLVGSIFKIMHWPGAAALLLLGIFLMSFVFLPLMFLLKTKDATSKRDKLVTGIGTLVGILLCVSTLFAVMHWPGRTALWLSTSAVSMFVLVPVYFFTGIRNPITKANTIVTTIILIGATGLLFFLTNLRPSLSIERANFYANQDLAATLNYATEQNKNHYAGNLKDSTTILKELKEKSDALCLEIEQLKLAMVNALEGTNDKVINYTSLTIENSSNYDVPTSFLFDHNGVATSTMIKLKEDVIEFNSFVNKNYNKNSFGLINTADTQNVNEGGQIPWEVMNFNHVPFGTMIRNLTQLQLDIRIVEGNCIH